MMFASDNLFIFFNKKQQHNYYQVKLSTKEYYVITRSSSLLKPQLFRTYKTNFIFHEKHILTFLARDVMLMPRCQSVCSSVCDGSALAHYS